MKRNSSIQKLLALAMCLAMLAGMTALPAAAAPEEDAPAAQEAAVQADTAAKEEAPAEDEAPVKEETPAEDEAPAKEETPAKDEAPAKEETPTEDKAPAKEETPTEDKAPAKEETPAEDKAPAEKEAPAEEEPSQEADEPAAEPEPEEEPEDVPAPTPAPARRSAGAQLFSATPAAAGGAEAMSMDWASEEVKDGKLGVVETSRGYYIYTVTDEWSATYVDIAVPGQWYDTTVMTLNSYPWVDLDVITDSNGDEIEGSEVTYYVQGGKRYSEIFIPTASMPQEETGFLIKSGDTVFDFTKAPEAEPFQVDWDEVEMFTYGQNTWSIVQGDGGYYLYFDVPAQGEGVELGIFYDEEPGKEAARFNYQPYDPGQLMTFNGVSIDEAQVNPHNEGDRLITEVFLPGDYFSEFDFTLMYGQGNFMDSGDIALKPGQTASDLPDSGKGESSYDGIAIDGDFHDWDAVPKTPIDDFHDGLGVDEVAVVWDGDYVYIYLAENGVREPHGAITGTWNSVCASGPNSNGQFAITTDLGRTMLIQPVVGSDGEPGVAGVDGASAAVNNKDNNNAPHRWELAIPASELPEYLESFSFGYHLVEPTLTDLTNLQDAPGGVDPFANNVVIDGKYNDWVGYPHSIIEYDEPGIQHHKVDGEAALWSDDGVLYGHVVTEHPDHLAEQGSEFLAAITIAFNGDRDYKEYPTDGNFYPRILAIAEDGSVTDYYKTVNEGHSTPNGTYTYYIFDTRTDPVKQFGHTDENGVWHDADAADLIANAFGTMKVTVTGEKDDMEFDLDLAKVADYIGADADDFRLIEAQFGRIGPQWVRTAGTPTGPILSVALAIGAVGAPACYAQVKRRRKRKGEMDTEAGEAK